MLRWATNAILQTLWLCGNTVRSKNIKEKELSYSVIESNEMHEFCICFDIKIIKTFP